MRVHVASLVYDSKAKNAVKIIALDYTPALQLVFRSEGYARGPEGYARGPD